MRVQTKYAALVVFVLAAIGAWTGYWFWLQGQVEGRVAAWIEARRAEGLEIADAGRATGGFPMRLEMRVEAPRIARPGAWSWQADEIWVLWQPWNLRHVIVKLGRESEIGWREGEVMRKAVLAADHALASGMFGAGGRLESGALDLGNPRLDLAGAGPVTARRAQLHSRANHGETANRPDGTQSASLQLEGMVLPPQIEEPLGQAIAYLRLDATFPPPVPPPALARAPLEGWRAAGGVINFDRVEVRWGPLDAQGDGTLSLDQALRPLGAFSADVRGFGAAVDAYVAAGRLKPGHGRALKLGLNALAKTDGQGRPAVKLPVTAQDGRLFVGPVGVSELKPVVPAE